MSHRLRSAITFGILVLSAAGLLAQTNQADIEDPPQHANARCYSLLCEAPVLGAPFSAEAVMVWQPPASSGKPEMRATALYYRSAAGRVRVDQRFVGDDQRVQRIILVPDASSAAAYQLDPIAQTVSPIMRGLARLMVGGDNLMFVLPLSMSRFMPFLNERINGDVERSLSSELNLVLHARGADPQIGVVEYRLIGIDRTEPSADLFELPAGYSEVAIKYPLRWENPYASKTSLVR